MPLMRKLLIAVVGRARDGVVMVRSHLFIAHWAAMTTRAVLSATGLHRRAGASCMTTCFLYWLTARLLGTPSSGEQPRPLLARTLAPRLSAPAPAGETVCTVRALRAA